MKEIRVAVQAEDTKKKYFKSGNMFEKEIIPKNI